MTVNVYEMSRCGIAMGRATVALVRKAEGDQRIVGVVTVETTTDGPIDLAVIELLQAALDLLAPVLRLRRSDDRPLPVRAWVSTRQAGKWRSTA